MSYSLNRKIVIPIKCSLGYRTALSRLLDWLVLISAHSLSNAFQSYFNQLHWGGYIISPHNRFVRLKYFFIILKLMAGLSRLYQVFPIAHNLDFTLLSIEICSNTRL